MRNDGRLVLRYIEPKAKTVQEIPGCKRDINLSPGAGSRLNILIQCVRSGTPVPDYFYSVGTPTGIDNMLGKFGILHLHLAGNELLYCIQYPDCIMLVAFSDHRYFDRQSPGADLDSAFPNTTPKPAPPISPKVDPAKVKAGILPRKTTPKTEESFMRRMINIVTETFRNGG